LLKSAFFALHFLPHFDCQRALRFAQSKLFLILIYPEQSEGLKSPAKRGKNSSSTWRNFLSHY
jgi:hypothetical protein